LFFIFICHQGAFSQRSKADSLERLLQVEKTDTGRAKLMWTKADVMNMYDPEMALVTAQQALGLSTRIKYTEGQVKSLGSLANTLLKLGNYPRALEYNFKKLQLEEKRNKPASLASTLMNIGIVYRYQEQFKDALFYYRRSDSVIEANNISTLRYYSLMNLGDVYDKMGNNDSAFSYFNKALVQSNLEKNDDYIGNAMTGLGHTYLQQGNYPFALLNYHTAIRYLQAANDDEVLSEATLGHSSCIQQLNKSYSAYRFANISYQTAEKGGFLANQMEATQFLVDHFSRIKRTDSAFFYLNREKILNDSINSRSKIREMQIISGNEQLRQAELEENRKNAERERKQQLQYLFIGIFIPGFFLLTLLLSRIRIHSRVIKVLGILSLLILFEFLTLLLHPWVAKITNHTPVLEMLIFVSFAALIIPIHHRIEVWLIKKLTHREDRPIRLKKVRLTVNKPPE